MKLGIHMGDFTLPGAPESLGPTLAATAKAADDAGCALFTVMDHWFQMEALSRAQDPMLEGYTSLGFVAAHTERIRIGLLVTGVTYRHPGLLVKTSRRSTCSPAAAPSSGSARRGTSASTSVSACRSRRWASASSASRRRCRSPCRCGATTTGPTRAATTALAETLCVPPPLTRPRPPILIGGGGERKTLRLVAQYADACNLVATQPRGDRAQARGPRPTLRRRRPRRR